MCLFLCLVTVDFLQQDLGLWQMSTLQANSTLESLETQERGQASTDMDAADANGCIIFVVVPFFLWSGRNFFRLPFAPTWPQLERAALRFVPPSRPPACGARARRSNPFFLVVRGLHRSGCSLNDRSHTQLHSSQEVQTHLGRSQSI